MAKKTQLYWLGLLLMLLLCGCETIAYSFKGFTEGAAKGAAEGAKKDWANIQKTDDWMRKNLW